MLITGITEKVGKFLRENNVNLSELSRKTGIPYNLLYASVWDRKRIRELRVNEFFSVCKAIGVDVNYFLEKEEQV